MSNQEKFDISDICNEKWCNYGLAQDHKQRENNSF